MFIFISGYACLKYLIEYDILPNIKGIIFIPKSKKDWLAIKEIYFSGIARKYKNLLKSNRLYAFIEKIDEYNYRINNNLL